MEAVLRAGQVDDVDPAMVLEGRFEDLVLVDLLVDGAVGADEARCARGAFDFEGDFF